MASDAKIAEQNDDAPVVILDEPSLAPGSLPKGRPVVHETAAEARARIGEQDLSNSGYYMTPEVVADGSATFRATGKPQANQKQGMTKEQAASSVAAGRRFEETVLSGISGFDHPDKLMKRRGWLFLFLIVGCIGVVTMPILIHFKHASMPVRALPSIAFTSSEIITKISPRELRVFTEQLISRMNRWSSWNLDGTRKSVLPFFSPEIANQIDSKFLNLAKENAKDGWRRNCYITGSLQTRNDSDIVYTVEVYYDVEEALEKAAKRAEGNRFVREMVFLDVIRVDKTDENDVGLQVTNYHEFSEDEYIKRFGEDPWSAFRSVPKKAP